MSETQDDRKDLRWRATFELEHRVQAYANLRVHWSKRNALIRKDREALALGWMGAGRPRPPRYPAVVTFTRISARGLDGDNLISAFKGMRDELAKRFQLPDDGGPEVLWHYRQTTPKAAGKAPGFHGVRVEIEC